MLSLNGKQNDSLPGCVVVLKAVVAVQLCGLDDVRSPKTMVWLARVNTLTTTNRNQQWYQGEI